MVLGAVIGKTTERILGERRGCSSRRETSMWAAMLRHGTVGPGRHLQELPVRCRAYAR